MDSVTQRRLAALVALPKQSVCWCAPGVGTVDEAGFAVCDGCGRIMLAATAHELLMGWHTQHVADEVFWADLEATAARMGGPAQ